MFEWKTKTAKKTKHKNQKTWSQIWTDIKEALRTSVLCSISELELSLLLELDWYYLLIFQRWWCRKRCSSSFKVIKFSTIFCCLKQWSLLLNCILPLLHVSVWLNLFKKHHKKLKCMYKLNIKQNLYDL